MHTGGEPLRVVLSGLPPIQGRTVLDKRRFFREHYDYLRTGLMWEPRGHADMYGAVVTPSESADFDVFFLHNEGYSTMCGHAIIALTKLVLEGGLIGNKGSIPELTINVPAGTVHASARMHAGKVEEVSFRNAPSFAYMRGQHVEVPELGRLDFDVAYGGAFYAIVEASQLGLELTAEHYSRLIDCGMRIKRTVADRFLIEHPTERDLSFLYGTIFTGPPENPRHHSRNVTVFAEGEVDRSATGTGVSARAALHFANGEVRLGERLTVESIVGSTMSVCALEQTAFASYKAIVPEVTGTAHVIAYNDFYFEPDDPFGHGFILR